jgi:hypothetical protein
MSIRVALFVTTFLGFMYGVLSLTNESKTDTALGMIVAAAGIIGWGILDWIEENR